MIHNIYDNIYIKFIYDICVYIHISIYMHYLKLFSDICNYHSVTDAVTISHLVCK